MSCDKSHSERFADWVSSLRFEDIPKEVVENVKLRLLDTIGICFASSRMSFADIVVETVRAWGGRKESSVIGFPGRLPAPNAALANGLMAHGLDFDDTHIEAEVHPSAVVIPTTLAIGEREETDGKSALTAAVAGYEVDVRLGKAAPFQFDERGFHATPIAGTFAASLIAGKLLGLNVKQLVDAVGICGSMAAGLQEFLVEGASVKQIHAGWAAHSGIVAALLGGKGLGGPRTIFEGRFGLYRSHLGQEDFNLNRLSEDLGEVWETAGIAFKPYPCCHIIQPYMDCMIQLKRRYVIAPHRVAQVKCYIAKGAAKIVCEEKEVPRTPYHAKFSLPYVVSLMLIKGRAEIEDFTQEAINDESVLRLARKVKWEDDPTSEFPKRFPGWVQVTMDDGKVYELRISNARGSVDNPLRKAELLEKFHRNALRALPIDRVDEIVQTIEGFEKLDQLTDLCEQLNNYSD